MASYKHLDDLNFFVFSQNFDYLTNQDTKAEPLVELDESIKLKLQQMLKEPDTDADIMWITVSQTWVRKMNKK